jgi:DNA-binding transcriptional ArsR family regulator
MAKYAAGSLDATFAALADPTRRAILARLAEEGEASVSELAAPFQMTLPAFGKHLDVLQHAGLIRHAKEGRVRRCWLVPPALRRARDWIDQYRLFWEGQLGALSAYLEEENGS